MTDKLPEEMTKGELLVQLLYKGEANLANTVAMENTKSRVELLEQCLAECRAAGESLVYSPPELAEIHLNRIKAACDLAMPVNV